MYRSTQQARDAYEDRLATAVVFIRRAQQIALDHDWQGEEQDAGQLAYAVFILMQDSANGRRTRVPRASVSHPANPDSVE